MFYDRYQFKTALELRKAVRTWNMVYNNLEHIALAGLTPVETVRNYSYNKKPQMCVPKKLLPESRDASSGEMIGEGLV